VLLVGATLARAQGPIPAGPEFQVNTYTTSSQSGPSVAMDPDGAFVVVWQSYGSGGTDTSGRSIQGQRFATPEPASLVGSLAALVSLGLAARARARRT
jgi:hypothetical protein